MLCRRAAFFVLAAFTFRALALPGADGPRTRHFEIEYSAQLDAVPDGAKSATLWIPVPHNDLSQTIAHLSVVSSRPYVINKGLGGNLLLSVTTTPAAPVKVTMRFEAVRSEHRIDLRAPATPDVTLGGQERARYLAPDRLVPIDDQIRKWAREVVDAAHADSDVAKARAIYQHVVSTVKYDKSGKGWGRGDIYYACENRRGNCTDFHAIFIGYARAVGIPARFAIGFPLPPDRGAGQIAGYHCWAEFFAEGHGWVPIDASEAAKDPSRREYFFGAHDENRIEFTRGRDLTLIPPQAGPPLNYFIYPYSEADGKPVETVSHTVSYKDLP